MPMHITHIGQYYKGSNYPDWDIPNLGNFGHHSPMSQTAPNRIEHWRKKRKMSRAALASALNSGASTIEKLENGKRRLTVEWMKRIAPVLGCSPSDLLNESDGAHPQSLPLDASLLAQAIDEVERALAPLPPEAVQSFKSEMISKVYESLARKGGGQSPAPGIPENPENDLD